MPQAPAETDSLPTHIDWLSFFAGALEYSPGNHELVAAFDAVIAQLQAAQRGQYDLANGDQRLRGGEAIVLHLMDPIVRELERLEKAYVSSPAGKSWTPLFGTSAAAGWGNRARRSATRRSPPSTPR